MAALFRVVTSVLAAAVASSVLFAALVLLPFLAMMLLYGTQQVLDAPAHGGAYFLLSIPVSGAAALFAFFFLSVFFYRRLSARLVS